MRFSLRSKLPSVFSVLTAYAIIVAAIILPLPGSIAHAKAASSISWNAGDVFVAVSNGQYNVFNNTGVLKDSVNDGLGGFTTGCAFNGSQDKLYTTNFTNNTVEVYDTAVPHTLSQTINIGADGGSAPESLVFASNGDFYVGNANTNVILRYNSAGTLQQAYTAATEDRGTEWLDLSFDQKTIFYTSEGGRIMRLDVSGTGSQLADFANIGGTSYALRLLPPGDGSGGLLVANTNDIVRLNGSGFIVQTYDVAGEDSWFSLNLDPNGTSFWAGDFTTGDFYRFNIATGAVEVGPINTGTGAGTVFGVCVKGEPTVAIPEISLRPQSATDNAIQGAPHTITATVKEGGQPVAGTVVTFNVVSGPNTGATGTCAVNVSCATDSNGQVAFTYLSNGIVGTDTIQACFIDTTGTQDCTSATEDWVTPPQGCATPQPGPGPFNTCVNTDPADTTSTQSEASVAVSSVNSPGTTVLVAFNDAHEGVGYSVSYDGGAHFTDQHALPRPSNWVNVGDPVVTVDKNGSFYIARIAEKAGTLKLRGTTSLFVALNKCTDSPQTGINCNLSGWPKVVSDMPFLSLAANDKPGITYDPVNNRVYVTWTHDTSSFRIVPFPALPGTDTIRLRYYDVGADNLSQTYDLYTATSGSVDAGLNGSFPVVTSDGVVHVFFESGLDSNTNRQIVYVKFASDGTISDLFNLANVLVTGSPTPGCGGNAYHTQAFDNQHAARTNEFPSATVDNNGNIDVAWNTGSPSGTAGESVISVATLVQGTDQANIQVLPDKQDSNNIPLIQWQPTIAVAGGTNTLVVTYFQVVQLTDGTYQLERDQVRAQASSNPVFGSASLISTQLWGPNQTNPPLDESPCYMGDYSSSASTPTENVVWVYWGDSRNVTRDLGPQPDIYGLSI